MKTADTHARTHPRTARKHNASGIQLIAGEGIKTYKENYKSDREYCQVYSITVHSKLTDITVQKVKLNFNEPLENSSCSRYWMPLLILMPSLS